MTLLDMPAPQRRALDLVKEVAVEKNFRPYLVGGPVRDMLLGRASIDVDLTLEDGSSTLARALAKRVDGRVRSFPQFLTYKVVADGFPEIDIATARKERYRKPGALPTVSAGKLRDDLLRRDFSVNAIALDLVGGSMHDPTNGERDLRDRVIRVLHDQSFVDDPTRIFRAVRLAERLGFAVDPHTERLMRLAVEGGTLQSISRERIWRELFLAMDESEAPAILERLREEGVLDVLFGERSPDETLRNRLELVRTQIQGDRELDRYVLYTSALLDRKDVTPSQLEGSGFSQKRARNVLHLVQDIPKIEQGLMEANTDRQRFKLYHAVSPEMLSAISARHPEQSPHVQRFREFENFKLALRGTELEVPGGPHVAKALERTREAVFTGEIPADEARAFARQMAIKYLSREAAATEPK